jgi:hypothetical protein
MLFFVRRKSWGLFKRHGNKYALIVFKVAAAFTGLIDTRSHSQFEALMFGKC